MEFMQNILEYYDELYPVTSIQKDFYRSVIGGFSVPPKVLSIGCGTGSFEHYLSLHDCDVTGIDDYPEFLEAANRRRRQPGVSIRFFQMSTLEMARFLKKGFYSVISCLNNRLVYISDTTLMKKFFFDCKTLLAEGGICVFSLSNFALYARHESYKLPPTGSIRVTLHTEVVPGDPNGWYLVQVIDTGKGKKKNVVEKRCIFPITPEEIREYAAAAGFKKIEMYGSFNRETFLPEKSPAVVCVLG